MEIKSWRHWLCALKFLAMAPEAEESPPSVHQKDRGWRQWDQSQEKTQEQTVSGRKSNCPWVAPQGGWPCYLHVSWPQTQSQPRPTLLPTGLVCEKKSLVPTDCLNSASIQFIQPFIWHPWGWSFVRKSSLCHSILSLCKYPQKECSCSLKLFSHTVCFRHLKNMFQH